MRWGVYIHIPFCRQKCYYCDFPSFAGKEPLMERYTAALCHEILAQGSCLSKWGKAATVYIGGGTPTALPPELLLRVLQTVRESMPVECEAEITVEANPGTVDEAYLSALHGAGANRLSLGVQSFSDRLLRRIGRIHTGKQAQAAIAMAGQAGFQNVSLDLMYGLPGQSMEDLQESIEIALFLHPKHISIYGLQLEEGTVFARQHEMGRLELPTEEEAEAMYDYMTESLPSHGYERYEISNFALPGFESRHNLGYWQDVPYLGLGVAAHSYWEGERRENIRDISEYIEAIEQGWPVSRQEEQRTREIAMEEFCFLALRTAKGIEKAAFRDRFQCSLESVYADVIQRMKQQRLLEEDGRTLRLTKLGMKYGNVVFAEFCL